MKGIAVAGSILVDKINAIAAYPREGELAKIQSVGRAAGGCVPNVSIALKTLDPARRVCAVGRVGLDEDGEFVKQELTMRGIECDIKEEGRTSFTEVMSVAGGQRTFFCYTGASAEFGYGDIDFDALECDMLHLGYFLLLDRVDHGDGERILKEAKRRGMRTSIDLVSENSDRYSLVLPCLSYVDNLIINETEAGRLAGIDPDRGNLKSIARKLMEYGVRERVIIHTPELAISLHKGEYTELASYELPEGFIKGTTGAGDAFCAGCLLGIDCGVSEEEILKMGTLAGTAALSRADAVSGIRELETLRGEYVNFKRRRICW